MIGAASGRSAAYARSVKRLFSHAIFHPHRTVLSVIRFMRSKEQPC